MAPLDSPVTPASVDADNPWLGLASFTEETQAYFYGRDEEVAELARRVQRKLLTLLFGQSGLGKTSILRAGIVPRLRAMGYCPVYVRIDYSADAPLATAQIKAAVVEATEQAGHWTRTGVAVEGESLWEFLHHRDDVLRDASGKPLTPLLIFDQFEEIFTLAQTDDAGRARAAQFIEDLADLVENRPPQALEAAIDADESAAERFDFARSDYRILIALREDYLAHLEALKGVMPSITQNRMRLARMTGAQALAAVLKPGGKLVSEKVAEAVVRFIAGGSDLRTAEVEPSLLSLICRELNNARIAQGRSEISADLLAGSHESILAEFYERALADQPAAVRRFIEDHLLTDSGFRESIAEERVRKAFDAVGAAPDALATLVDRRLLRIEERLDLRRVELTHDVLCSVVRASRDVRQEREARDAAERQLAEQQARERATRKALMRARQVAAVCAVLAIGAIASAIFGYESTKRAQRAEAQAQQTRTMAESARGEAEKLIVYLLDDFDAELEPIGRLDIVAELAKRALNYYDALPAALHSRETERNRALALVRYGAVLRTQAKLDESRKALSEAIDTLTRLRREGDQSELNALGMSLGLTSQAGALFSVNRRPEGRQSAEQAVAVLEPLIAKGSPSIPLLRTYGGALLYFGYTDLGIRDDRAVSTFEKSRTAFRSIDGLSLGNLPAAAAFTEATAWELSGLQRLGRFDDAKRIGEESARVAGEILERRPGYMPAIRARALITSALSEIAGDAMHLRDAVASSKASSDDWESILRIDATNSIAWNNLAVTEQNTGEYLFALGRDDEARTVFRTALDVGTRTTTSVFLAPTLSGVAGELGGLEADQGNRRQAQALHAENVRLIAIAVRDLPANAPARSVMGAFSFSSAYAVPLADGDYETVRKLALDELGRAEHADATVLPALWKRQVAKVCYALADASYRLNDLTGAARAIAKAQDYQRQGATRGSLRDQRDAAELGILAAMIAARQNRLDDARTIIAPVLAFERDLHARNREDVMQHIELARALYASALASNGKPSPELTRAESILRSLPPAASRRISVRRLREDIAQAAQRRPLP